MLRFFYKSYAAKGSFWMEENVLKSLSIPSSMLTCLFFYNSATAPSVLGGIYFYENTLIYLQNPPNFRSTLHIHDVEVENVYIYIKCIHSGYVLI